MRWWEQLDSAKRMETEGVFFLDDPDTELEYNGESIMPAEKVIDKVTADTAYTHWGGGHVGPEFAVS